MGKVGVRVLTSMGTAAQCVEGSCVLFLPATPLFLVHNGIHSMKPACLYSSFRKLRSYCQCIQHINQDILAATSISLTRYSLGLTWMIPLTWLGKNQGTKQTREISWRRCGLSLELWMQSLVVQLFLLSVRIWFYVPYGLNMSVSLNFVYWSLKSMWLYLEIISLISHASKVMLKILQARFQQYVNRELPDVQAGFRKGKGQEIKLPTSAGSLKKQESSRKTSISALLTMPKFLCGSQ